MACLKVKQKNWSQSYKTKLGSANKMATGEYWYE